MRSHTESREIVDTLNDNGIVRFLAVSLVFQAGKNGRVFFLIFAGQIEGIEASGEVIDEGVNACRGWHSYCLTEIHVDWAA